MPARLPRGGGYVWYSPFGLATAVFFKPLRKTAKDTPLSLSLGSKSANNTQVKADAVKTLQKRKTASKQSEPTESKRKVINSVMRYEVST